MDRAMGVDRKMVQGEAGDTPEAEGEGGQMGRMACADMLGAVCGRCDCNCAWILQDASVLDNYSDAGGKIREVLCLESDLWPVLIHLVKM